jgi:hypothetical protein
MRKCFSDPTFGTRSEDCFLLKCLKTFSIFLKAEFILYTPVAQTKGECCSYCAPYLRALDAIPNEFI